MTAERRCATPGCTGTLPAGTGTHCPRCGGKEFLPTASEAASASTAANPPRRRRKALPIILLLLLAIGGAIILSLTGVKHSQLPSTGIPADRKPLMESKAIADQMSVTTTRDDAYSDIIQRALLKHDFEYACEVANSIGVSTTKDQVLQFVVDDALRSRQTAWAKRAAENMMVSTNRDKALRQVMDASH